MEQTPQSEDEEFQALRNKRVEDMSFQELLRARDVLNNRRLDLKKLLDESPDDEELKQKSAESEGMFADVQYKIEGVDDEA